MTEFRQHPVQFETDDEISLIELWLIASRRKWQILAGLLATLALAALYLVLAMPTYLSRAVVAVGEVPDVGSLESPALVVKRLREQYRVDDHADGPRELPYLESVRHNEREAENVVELTALGHTAEEAQSFLRTVTEKLISGHTTRYRSVYENQMEMVAGKESALQEMEREIQRLSGLIGTLQNANATQASFLMMERSNLLTRKAETEEQLRELRGKLLVLSNPTRFLREPTLPLTQESPKPLLVIGIAFIIGAFLGIFAAFFLEFLVQARRQVRRLRTDTSP